MRFEFAPDIQERINRMINILDYGTLDTSRIICMRSYNSKSNAYARIWGLSRVWAESPESATALYNRSITSKVR